MIDWKKIARERKDENKYLRYRLELLGLQMQQELHRALIMQFHARCFERAGELADEISVEVARRVVEVAK